MPILTPEERIGTVIADRYKLDAIIGTGGMGVVFSGTHTWTKRRVAVKVLSPDYARRELVVSRFLQEARTAAELKHPNVVDVLDMGEDADGTVFLALELLEGEPLYELMDREGPLSPKRTLETLLPVMSALRAAHRRGIVHRDIKPDNIFLSRSSTGQDIPKLLDFGIAKVMESASRDTVTGAVVGTPYYMSPEQAAGDGDIGPQSDIWSMGVVLYECMANALPFKGSNRNAVLLSIAVGNPTKLKARAPEVPAALATAIDCALFADRESRYPSMQAFIDTVLEAAEISGVDLAVTWPKAGPGTTGAAPISKTRRAATGKPPVPLDAHPSQRPMDRAQAETIDAPEHASAGLTKAARADAITQPERVPRKRSAALETTMRVSRPRWRSVLLGAAASIVLGGSLGWLYIDGSPKAAGSGGAPIAASPPSSAVAPVREPPAAAIPPPATSGEIPTAEALADAGTAQESATASAPDMPPARRATSRPRVKRSGPVAAGMRSGRPRVSIAREW